MEPLVSCLTPTYNRREFFPRAVKCFLSQDYPNLEWIIVDDGTDPIQDLLPADPRIRYFRELPKQGHGAKMNRCFTLAQGEYGIVWDDDDWYAPARVRLQVEPMIANSGLQVTGLGEYHYYVHGKEQAYHFKVGKTPWMGAIALRRVTWLRLGFDTLPAPGADNRLLQKIPREAWHRVENPDLLVAAIHATNDCKKPITSSYVSEPWTRVQSLLES